MFALPQRLNAFRLLFGQPVELSQPHHRHPVQPGFSVRGLSSWKEAEINSSVWRAHAPFILIGANLAARPTVIARHNGSN